MDLARIFVTMLGTALIALNLWFFFGKDGKRGDGGATGAYACPMHPWITSNDPSAECSLCGMKLVKK